MVADGAEEDWGCERVGAGLVEVKEGGRELREGFGGRWSAVRVEDVDEEVTVLDADHGAW